MGTAVNGSIWAVEAVGHEQHVRLVDGLEAADRRAIEPEPVLEDPLAQLRDGDGEVLPEAGEVDEAQIDDLGALFLGHLEDVLRGHACPPPSGVGRSGVGRFTVETRAPAGAPPPPASQHYERRRAPVKPASLSDQPACLAGALASRGAISGVTPVPLRAPTVPSQSAAEVRKGATPPSGEASGLAAWPPSAAWPPETRRRRFRAWCTRHRTRPPACTPSPSAGTGRARPSPPLRSPAGPSPRREP